MGITALPAGSEQRRNIQRTKIQLARVAAPADAKRFPELDRLRPGQARPVMRSGRPRRIPVLPRGIGWHAGIDEEAFARRRRLNGQEIRMGVPGIVVGPAGAAVEHDRIAALPQPDIAGFRNPLDRRDVRQIDNAAGPGRLADP